MNLEQTISKITPLDETAMERCRKRWNRIAKPLHSLGELEELLIRIAGIRGTEDISIRRKALAVFCADNGVVEEGVTQTGQEVTAIVAENFLDHASCAAILCENAGAELFPYDVGMAIDTKRVEKRKVRCGTANIAKAPAMSREEAVATIETGIQIAKELKEKGYDLFACGEMGIGNTTTSSAVLSVLLDCDPAVVTGRGAGLSDQGLRKKIAVIRQAIAENHPDPDDPVDVISKVGGLDLAALTGFMLGAAALRIPVVLDGFITATAALVAVRLAPQCRDFLLPSHKSGEPGTALVMEELELHPVIRAGMHLGEGTGAVMLFPLLTMAADIYQRMGTFSDIQVEEYQEFRGEAKEIAEEGAPSDRKRILILTYTPTGAILGSRVKEALKAEKEAPAEGILLRYGEEFESTEGLLWKKWDRADVILFLSASGIAVRSIAPFLKSKTTDPAVLVMDEKGNHVISLVSGHLGGANEWCLRIASLLQAEPVITTATDLSDAFAVDLFAKKNKLMFSDTAMLRRVSSEILKHHPVGILSEVPLPEPLPEGLISIPNAVGNNLPECGIRIVAGLPEKEAIFQLECLLSAKNLVLGIGCRKGKAPEELLDFVKGQLARLGIEEPRITAIASIDLKKEEVALQNLSEALGVAFLTFSAEELNRVSGDFSGSAFVQETTGTDSVAERSALAAAGEGARLLLPKTAENGMTLAIAAQRVRLTFGRERQ